MDPTFRTRGRTLVSQVTVGSFVSVYWPLDDTYYQARVVGASTAAPSTSSSSEDSIFTVAYTDGDNNNDAEGLPERPPPKPKNIWQTVFDPIVTSPILPFILIWGPFLQNPYNKRKWAELTADANPIVVNGFLGTVAFSIVSYFVYNARVEAAEEASEIRELALRDLRTARQGQFTSNKNQQTTSDAVQEAASAYEEALRKEMQLRWISPQLGWRLDFPDDPASREEDKAAAKQFLGLEITDDGNIVELN